MSSRDFTTERYLRDLHEAAETRAAVAGAEARAGGAARLGAGIDRAGAPAAEEPPPDG